jgi:hypothetical protein
MRTSPSLALKAQGEDLSVLLCILHHPARALAYIIYIALHPASILLGLYD